MWADNETNEDLLGYQVHADLLKEVVRGSATWTAASARDEKP